MSCQGNSGPMEKIGTKSTFRKIHPLDLPVHLYVDLPAFRDPSCISDA